MQFIQGYLIDIYIYRNYKKIDLKIFIIVGCLFQKMTDFSSYFLTIFSTKKNFQYYQKSENFDFEQNNKSVSFKNKNLLISRSALTGFLIQKLIRNPHFFQSQKSKQKQCKQIMSRWNKLEIPRPLPIKINCGNYTAIANHLNQHFVATGDYDGSVKIWRFQNYQYENSEKMLLKSILMSSQNTKICLPIIIVFIPFCLVLLTKNVGPGFISVCFHH